MSNTNYKVTSDLKELEYKLLYATKSMFESNWHSAMQLHYYSEMFYITRGNAVFKIEDQSINVKKDDLIIINPNVEHSESSLGDEAFEYICIGIGNLKFSSFGDNTNVDEPFFCCNLAEEQSIVLEYLNLLFNELAKKDKNYELYCDNIFSVLLEVMRKTEKQFLLSDSHHRTSSSMIAVKKYIDAHYSEDITLDTLSELTFMNKFHLAHSFKKHIGVSPIQYLIARRLDNAKLLITTTNYSIEKISMILGFNSSSYFSQIFKRQVGMTPKEYKKSQIQI